MKLHIPNSQTVKANIGSKFSEFDLSYSDEIKTYLANEMSVSIDELSHLNCAWFTDTARDSSDVIRSALSKSKTLGLFLEEHNLLILLADERFIEQITGVGVHEVGHFLTLAHASTSIAEGCAMTYERDWHTQKGTIDEFNKRCESNDSYSSCLKLLDAIKNTVFDGNEDEFRNAIKRGNDEAFHDKIDAYLTAKGCTFNAKELLLLADVAFYSRINFNSWGFEKREMAYFDWTFNRLHQKVFPVIFNNNSAPQEMDRANKILSSYSKIVKMCLPLTEVIDINASKQQELRIVLLRRLADEMYSWDAFAVNHYRPTNEHFKSYPLNQKEHEQQNENGTFFPSDKFYEDAIIEEYIKSACRLGIKPNSILRALNTIQTQVENFNFEGKEVPNDKFNYDMEHMNQPEEVTSFLVTKKPGEPFQMIADGIPIYEGIRTMPLSTQVTGGHPSQNSPNNIVK